MENQLIEIYLLVCHIYDTGSQTCFQRLSNNHNPEFTDQELISIYWFGHLNGFYQKKAIHKFIENYWSEWFPLLPSYQSFSYRLNLLEPSFQTIGGYLQELLKPKLETEIDRIVDSLPVMLAAGGHAYTARVARDIADVGYCAAKKIYFHGIRLHTIAQRRVGKLPLPAQIWLREASAHDLSSVKEQEIWISKTSLIGDLAFLDPVWELRLKEQNSKLYTPRKKPKGADLTEIEKYYNRLLSRLRQPIESLFNWMIEKTDIQRASKVRSTEGLMIHCWGKLTFVFFLLVFNS